MIARSSSVCYDSLIKVSTYQFIQRDGANNVDLEGRSIRYGKRSLTYIDLYCWSRSKAIDHFTVAAKLPGLIMEARLPVTLL